MFYFVFYGGKEKMKIRSNNILAFMLCALLVLSFALTGCAGKSDSNNPSVSETVSQTEESKAEASSASASYTSVSSTDSPSDVSSGELEIHDISVNTIPDATKQKARTFPDVDGELPLWRGVNVVDKAEFAWPWVATVDDPEKVTGTSETVYRESEAIEISEAGYNFVRLCLDSRYFFTEEKLVNLEHVGEQFYGDIDITNLTQYENLDEMIAYCIDRNIHVCLDCHSTYGGLMIGGDEEASRELLFTPGSDAQKMFVHFWDILAKRYEDIDTRALSFNLYNEPPTFASENEQVYVDLMNQAIDAIQTYTNDRLIFVDMMDYSRDGMKLIEDLHANNLVAGFHFYSSEATDLDKDTLDLAEAKSEMSTRLTDYAKYSTEKNVRWMLTEYGMAVYYREEIQEEYLGEIVDFCKNNNVPYALWSFNGGDFSICTWANGSDKYLTPGATYVETSQGHRINKDLVKITAE